MTSHLHRIRLLAGSGVGLALSGPVLALAGHGAAARSIALAGAGLLLWERAALALTRWWTARPAPADRQATPHGPASPWRG
ncbi:hypothetical protein AB0910_02400 [Streptomyces sp. NPDC047002]|uniref:hypothetical protein n=1 Tax=Streptomyces sp. NPDC047002 TaxID=3155475 RepID=UPI003456634D